jgi:glycerol uptake facilitator-like aquaporin
VAIVFVRADARVRLIGGCVMFLSAYLLAAATTLPPENPVPSIETIPPATEPASAAINDHFTGALWLGVLALFMLSLVYVILRLKDKSFSVTYARIYALVAIAGLAVALTFSTVVNEARTAAFTLLGTIAGYLAGAKPTNNPAEVSGDVARAIAENVPAAPVGEQSL